MEESAAGATATTTTAFAAAPSSMPYGDSPFDSTGHGLMSITSNERAVSHEASVPITSTGDGINHSALEAQPNHVFDPPALEPFEVPYLKTEEFEPDGLLALAGVNNSLASVPDAQQNWKHGDTMPFPDLDTTGIQELYDQPADSSTSHVFGAASEENNHVQAFALLKFSDGDFYVKSTSVLLGRDMAAWEQYQKEKKRSRKAQEAVELYRQEPSQPSQRGDDDRPDPSSKSSHSLEGRPAKSLPSNLSETGGIMRVDADSDDEILSKKKRRRRRIANISKSTSTTSVAPANLHMSVVDVATGNPVNNDGTNPPECVRLGVHPQNPEDMGKISREHLLLYFNPEEQRWDLEVKGNGVYIGDARHYRGEVVPLSHDDEVIFATVMFRFRLPDHTVDRGDTFNVDDESELTDSRQLSEAIADDESATLEQRQKSGLKIKLGKREKDKSAKTILKSGEKPKEPESAAPDSPEDEKKAGKHPHKSIKQPVATVASAPLLDEASISALQSASQTPAPIPAPPPQLPESIPLGSVFEGVKPEELPQKRKGPGRPPKNGLISKRDEGFIKRRRKEYEKRGEEPPPLDELLALIRAENKEKERLAKLAATGQPGVQPPSAHGAEMPPGVVRSIEASDNAPGAAPSAPSIVGFASAQGKRPSDSAAPSESARKPSPKPRRTVKSPSPQKPESAYTEEELKKPTQTYIILIDEALRNHPTGIMDLQEIYDKICKRYPYYKYRANTTGWQSSVRHNLISCERFVEAGKQGKGRLWKIDYSFPIDRDRKRRETAQDMRPPVMHNGQMQHPYPPGQYMRHGQQQGSNGSPPTYQNVQQQVQAGMQRPGGGYYSPYNGAQAGQPQPHLPPGQQPRAPPGQMQQGQQPHPHPGGQQPGAGNNPNDAGGIFNLVVNAIMDYRSQYLRKFHDSPQYAFHEELFKKCTNFVSNVYQGEEVKDEELSHDEEKRVFADLKAIITRFKGNRPDATNQSQQGSMGGQAVGNGSNQSQPSGMANAAPPQQQQQQAVDSSGFNGVSHPQVDPTPVGGANTQPPFNAPTHQAPPSSSASASQPMQQQSGHALQGGQFAPGQSMSIAQATTERQPQVSSQPAGQANYAPALGPHQQQSQYGYQNATAPASATLTASDQQEQELAALLQTANMAPQMPTASPQTEMQQVANPANASFGASNGQSQQPAPPSSSHDGPPFLGQTQQGQMTPVTNEGMPALGPMDQVKASHPPPVANMTAPSSDVFSFQETGDPGDPMALIDFEVNGDAPSTQQDPISVQPSTTAPDTSKPSLETSTPPVVTGVKRALGDEPGGQEVEAKRAKIEQAPS